MQNLISKSQLARLAGVNPATITRVASKQFPNAFVGKKIDQDHPEVVAYLLMRAEKQELDRPKPQNVPRETPQKVTKVTDSKGKNYTSVAKKYAEDVISGDIPAGKYIKLACQQFFDELKNPDSPYYYDNNAARRACKFIELQYHTKGKWAAQKKRLVLEPWQVFFVCNIFGWLQKKNDLRRYTEVLLLVPRKNGKSQLAAAIGLYMLCADGEYGAEVYSGATTEKQAGEVFVPAQIMARKNEEMAEHYGIDIRASNINIPETGAKFERLIGNPGDGSSPSCAIVDEYHEHPDDRLFDTMQTGMGAREQPLMLVITTAGDNLAGPCYGMQLKAQKMLDSAANDPDYDRIFALIYTVDSDDDWASVESLKKANPNFGVSVSEDFLLARLADAKNNARKQSVYKTKHLNVWVGARDAYFNVERWNETASDIKIEDYYGKRAFIGLDLASKVDIAALEILIPIDSNEFVKFAKYYLPEAALEGNDHYSGWARDGRITITDGELIDFNEIKCDILDLIGKFEVVELAYDPFQATMLITELMAEGVPVVEFRPTVLNFSEPMKQLDGLIRSRKVCHDGCPVFTWMLSNVVAKADAKDNVYPRKDRDENKIDGPVALISALGRYMNEDAANLDDFLNNPISVGL